MSFSEDILNFKLKCNKIRSLVMYMIHNAGSGHPGPSLSCVELVLSLYNFIMDHNPADPLWEDRDRFILSKGHAAPTLYAVLSLIGYIEEQELNTLRKTDSRLQGHPDMTMLECIEFSTGSLGKGISAAVGIAEALIFKANSSYSYLEKKVCSFSVPQVYVLIGDGELDEGITKEALAYAGAKDLFNLTVIIDNNGHQLTGKKEEILDTGPIESHFNPLQWNIINRYRGATDLNGHDYAHIKWAFGQSLPNKTKPRVLIFKTIKGKGVPFMEDDAVYHGVAPLDNELAVLTTKYNSPLKPSQKRSPSNGIFDIYEQIINHRLEESEKQKVSDLVIKDKLSPRDCVGKALVNEAEKNDRIVSIYADLMSSCKGDYFHNRFPERCYEVGIAENLMNMLAGGMAREGFIPFTNSFSIFQLESFGALRQIAYNRLNVKVLGSHGDPRLKDGGSHSEVSLISALRGMPGWHIFWPSDGIISYHLVSHIVDIKGPCFMKYSRDKVRTIYNGEKLKGMDFNNKIEQLDLENGYNILQDFSRDNKKKITVFAVGDLVFEAITAITDIITYYDLDIRLVDIFRLKPIPEDIIISSAKQGPVITAEASNIHGGLFGIVSETTSMHYPTHVFPLAVKDEFVKSGNYEELTEKHNLGHQGLINLIIRAAGICS